MQILDWISQSYTAHSRPLNASRCVNMFAEMELQDARSKAPVGVWGAAGISPFAVTTDDSILGLDMMNGVVYAVGNRHLWQVNSDATVKDLGTHKANGQISVDNNGIQLVWVDGSTGWYWQSGGGGVTQITDPNFFPCSTVTYFDGYFAFPRLGTKEFFLSPIFGITPFDGALFASKEATSDLLQSIANSHEQLYLFGQERTEVWYDAGNPPPTFPFQRSDGAIIQRGTIAPYSIVLEDNTLFFLGDDGMFYRLTGFVPQRISTHAVESEWSKYETLTDAQSLVYTVFGHKMVTITFPRAAKTWVCDLSTQRWHERESWIGSSADTSIGRWRGNCALNAYSRVLIGDSQSGRIGQLNFNAYTEWNDTMRGLIDGPPVHNDRKRVFMKRFELDVESGVGVPDSPIKEDLQYCLNPVKFTKPAEITIAALQGLAANYVSGLFSVWINLTDASATGMVLTNDGFSLQIDKTNITLALGGALSAVYPFTTWADWVNVMVSFDTVTQQVQVWASTLVASVWTETELTATSLTWSSINPVDGTGAWTLGVV